MITLASLFDGIGGALLCAERCGAIPIWASEIEPFPMKVTQYHFPNVKHYGDITKINGAAVEPVDIIVGGSPCQDLSIAGKRAGMKHSEMGDEDATRSGLFMEQIRIIKEMRNATGTNYPRFMVWENVPGAFSSANGEDFRAVLEETARVVDPSISIPRTPVKWANAGSILGDGFSISWRTVDAQYWGVPQRRRRIYLVADFRGQSAPEILFEREGLRGDITESRAEGGGVMLRENYIDKDGNIIVRDKVQIAIDRLKAFEPAEGYYLAFSGGKDSVVIKELANMAGVKYEAHYSLTTVDPPELVRFIKDKHKDVTIDYPKETMWKLIVENGAPPTRLLRYCCKQLKESNGKGRVTVTGVRWAESANRKKNRNLVNIGNSLKDLNAVVYNDENDAARRMVEQCYRTQKTLVNPIIDWSDDEVWQFIREEKIPYCKLYDEGFKRLGCIGCPMNTKAAEELERYPTYKQAYLTAFGKMLEARRQKGLTRTQEWKTPRDVMDWWLQKNKQEKQFDGQIEMEDAEDDNT